MINNLSIESLRKLCDSLEIDISNEQLILPSQLSELASKERIQSRIIATLNTPNPKNFSQLLNHILNTPEDAMMILEDKCCQNILIVHRPDYLPHWLLSLMEYQFDLALHLLQIDEYRNSLKRNEFIYLRENYPAVQELAIKSPIAESNDDKHLVTNFAC
jgi:hypothetical protein